MIYLARGGFWLGAGQGASAIISFVSSIFFANFISKDIYGNYKFIIAATSILGAFSLSGMGAVVTQGVARGFEGVLNMAIKASLRFGVIILILAASVSGYYFWNGNYILGFALIIAGITLPINQSYTLYGSYLMGKKDFKRVTLYNTGSQLLNTAAIIVVAVATQNIILMVLVYFTLNTLTTFLAYIHTTKAIIINNKNDTTLVSYGKHLSVMGAFGTIANQFDKILIFHYLGAINLAIYAFSQAIPDQLKGVLKNIFGIALPKYAALPEASLRLSIIKKNIQVTLITICIVIVLIAIMPLVFKFLFPKYLEAVIYAQIYMLGLITIPGISLFGIYFQLKKATKKLYELNVISNIVTLIITFIFIYKYSLMGAVIANGTSWFIMLLLYWYYFSRDTHLS